MTERQSYGESRRARKPVSGFGDTGAASVGVRDDSHPAVDESRVKPASSGTVRIQLIYPTKYVARVPSGRTYVWGGAGDVVTVALEDADAIMQKNGNATRGCCGSSGGRLYFQLAD